MSKEDRYQAIVQMSSRLLQFEELYAKMVYQLNKEQKEELSTSQVEWYCSCVEEGQRWSFTVNSLLSSCVLEEEKWVLPVLSLSLDFCSLSSGQWMMRSFSLYFENDGSECVDSGEKREAEEEELDEPKEQLLDYIVNMRFESGCENIDEIRNHVQSYLGQGYDIHYEEEDFPEIVKQRRRLIMDIRIQAIHFDATTQLEAFIQRKVSKLEQYFDGILLAEVTLKVVKPETANNKEASIRLKIKNGDCFAEKVNDTFEESIDECVEALEKQLVKFKEKIRAK